MSRDSDGAGADGDASEPVGDAEVVLSLPPELREALKEPLGPVETDPEAVLAAADGGPLIAVGDVVTYHLLGAGRTPDVAVVDGRTKRRAVDDAVDRAVTASVDREVTNPPAAITAALVRALARAIASDDPTTILVDGEEDLAVLPAIVAAPDGASVVYGQPDEGMVHVRLTPEIREEVEALLARFDGDHERLRALLESPRRE